ncbi:hypothetical protein BGAL_0015g00190 [Botrytis galanthina]|uniref:Uncharacterized protein n=1 Tax=Botrytis galanthina TaxID=278940 RepID=A0A4S8RMQ7_9HELO|nr:hypothetical protein BGAL_0015g00190 [Botrytis galanthina]
MSQYNTSERIGKEAQIYGRMILSTQYDCTENGHLPSIWHNRETEGNTHSERTTLTAMTSPYRTAHQYIT